MGKKISYEEFLKRSKKVHGDKYDYSKVKYVNGKTKVCIICPEHGEFWQTASCHLSGQGCPKCGLIKRAQSKRETKETFIEKAIKTHGNKYDYSKVAYEIGKKKVCIICPEHGEFWQAPIMHVHGNGCPECGKIKYSNERRKTTEQFISEAKEKWGEKYDYSKVVYFHAHKKICIICPKHGEFWQEPDNHLRWGCKHCRESSLEKDIENFLKENNIEFEKQKSFSWLKDKRYLKLDFFLPLCNVAIECQGDQHFERFRFENDNEGLNRRIRRDNIKKEKCAKHGIKILYYGVSKKYNECLQEEIIKTTKELLKKIKEYGN